jgi:hypothetical protein
MRRPAHHIGIGGFDAASPRMLSLYRRLNPVLARLRAGDIEQLHLSGRGSWRAELEGGAAIELGRGTDNEVLERAERFVRTRALAADGGVEALAAVINFSDHPLARTILPEDLGLAPGAYHAFELWTRSYQRLGRGQAVVTTQPPHGVALLLLRPQRPWPQVLTVTHHLGQTTVLLAHETWDAETATLVVGLHALAERSGEVLLALPAPWQLGAVSGSAGLAVGAWGRAPAGAYVTVSFTAPGGIEVLTLRFTGSQPAAAPQL